MTTFWLKSKILPTQKQSRVRFAADSLMPVWRYGCSIVWGATRSIRGSSVWRRTGGISDGKRVCSNELCPAIESKHHAHTISMDALGNLNC